MFQEDGFSLSAPKRANQIRSLPNARSGTQSDWGISRRPVLTPEHLQRWADSRLPNSHWQRPLPQVDGQLMGYVVPAFPDPVAPVPEELTMVCFKPEDWHALYESDC